MSPYMVHMLMHTSWPTMRYYVNETMQVPKATTTHSTTGAALPMLSFGITALVCLTAFIAWAQPLRWHVISISSYQLFPLFGLFAFSTLWSQYVVLTIRRLWHVPFGALGRYFKLTGFIVLVCILFHPGLLVWQLWRDGFGLPPESYLRNYVAPDLAWAAMLGTVSLLIFLSYELHRIFEKKSWWKYMVYACDIAMMFVFCHALFLGGELQTAWFKVVWLGYGVVLAAALLYLRLYKNSNVI